MALQGKGFYIWKIRDCEGGDANAILSEARKADLSHVLIKIADGTNTYNFDSQRRIDLVPPVARALKNAGIQVWGWQYIYGSDPIGEARKAVQRMNELGLDGFAVDAETEYKQPGKDVAARKYMQELRNALPELPIALSSFRYPSYHPQFPFKDFLEFCDLNMPQVYWQGAHNPDTQLIRSVREFQNFTPARPVFPTGAAYGVAGWTPTPEDIKKLLDSAKELNLEGGNFWSWDYARKNLTDVWNAVRDYPWPSAAPPKDMSERIIAALNKRDPLKATTLYAPLGVHVTAARTIQGPEAILAWYNTLLNQILPNAQFALTGYSGTGNSRHFTWTAASTAGDVLNGNDTLGLQDGKIAYHYTFFTVTAP